MAIHELKPSRAIGLALLVVPSSPPKKSSWISPAIAPS
jgi:hypothetical protein